MANSKIASDRDLAEIFLSCIEKREKYKNVKDFPQIKFVKGLKGKNYKEEYYIINADDIKNNSLSKDLAKENKLKEEYYVVSADDINEKLLPKNSFKVIIIYLDSVPKTNDENTKWLRLLGAETYEEMKEIAKGDKLMEEAVEENRKFSQRKDVQEYFKNHYE